MSKTEVNLPSIALPPRSTAGPELDGKNENLENPDCPGDLLCE